MADAVISVVLEQLRSILRAEVNLLAGVRKESEQLEDTLTLIRGVLEDAEEKQVKNEAVKVWLKQLTSISYDADDVLDKWKTQNLSSQIQQLDAPVSEKYTQDRVLVKIKSAEEKTVGGILLPFTAQSKPQGGEVVAVGDDSREEHAGNYCQDWSANSVLGQNSSFMDQLIFY